MCALTISCYLVPTMRLSLGSVFGVQSFLNGSLSSYGQQLGTGYSLLIIYLREVSSWLTSVVCVFVMRKL